MPVVGSDTPRTRAIGSTFQFTFILPKPANSGNTRPKKPKHTKPGRKNPSGHRQLRDRRQCCRTTPR